MNETTDVRDDIAAARDLVEEVTRKVAAAGGIGGHAHTALGRAGQLLLAAEDAETTRLPDRSAPRFSDRCREADVSETSTETADAAAQIEHLCEVMHDAYEKAAAGNGWATQEASRKPWADVPDANKATMRAAVTALLAEVAPDNNLERRVAAAMRRTREAQAGMAFGLPDEDARDQFIRGLARAAVDVVRSDRDGQVRS